jgi:hypothetical protein
MLLALLDVELRVILTSDYLFVHEHSEPITVLVFIATISEMRSSVRTLIIELTHYFTIVIPSHAHVCSPCQSW